MARKSAQPSRRPVSRRDFLAVGGLSVVGLPAAERAAKLRAQLGRGPKTVVLVIMNGGASALETFDPKPTAPKEVRGPYRAVETSMPGIFVSETLPRLAERAKKFSLIRSIHHTAAPIHETGLQLLQAGTMGNRKGPVAAFGTQLPSTEAVADETTVPAYVVTPARLRLDRGPAFPSDGAGETKGAEPAVVRDGIVESDGAPRTVYAERFEKLPYSLQDAYGHSSFGRRLWNARQLVEYGATWITVNLFDTLAGHATWDAHGNGSAPATIQDYGRTLCPQFDRAMAGFLDDLVSTGLWNDVLVICTGEMGRTPRINRTAGRDHWTRCWSALVAGAGVPGGQVIGSSDSRGAEVMEEPVPVQDLTSAAFRAARGADPKAENGIVAKGWIGRLGLT
ncbi:MAG TPA: DUF1501 domain-containing protein [Caulifigura sp.]|nr:DUF1501 domain-containing protein [Caulifigura sp.]